MLFTLAGLAAPAGCGTGAGVDLPAVLVAQSPHFRYYARAADRVPAAIVDLLERHWTMMSTFFGLSAPTTFAYYLYDDEEDVRRHSPCGDVRACQFDYSAHAAVPFFEHELLHVYFWALGAAPPIIAEGLASGLSCFEYLSSPEAPPADLSWQHIAGMTHRDLEGASIDYGATRLVRYLIRRYGPKAFARFYQHSEYTLDPALFALEFDAFWGESIDAVWTRVTAPHTTPTYLDGAMCPCSTAALPLDGSGRPVIEPYAGYAFPSPFTLPAEAGLAVSLEGLGRTTVRNCWDQDYEADALQADIAAAPTAVALLRMRAGHYYVQALPQGTSPTSVSAVPGSWLSADCASGETFSVPVDFVGNFEVLAPGFATYLQFAVAGPLTVTVNPGLTALSFCPACASPATDCTTVPPSTSVGLMLDGSYTVSIAPGQRASLSFQ